jgi:endoglycosylceramidase
VVILRGINLSGDSKVPPFQPGIGAEDLDRLEALGMNVIRLVFIWEAYEPAPGAYDDAYLASLQSIAAAAWARGIYTIVDIHQDGFSRHASRGSGDGFPRWAVSQRCRPSTPDNGPGCKNWPMLMATDLTTHRSFDDFFADTHGVRTRFLMMTSRIAAAFAKTPGVVGYDLMNEPWGDEQRELAPLYRDTADAIRARHPSAVIFLEGHVTTNCGLQTELPRPATGNAAYAPHYYRPTTILLKRWHGATLEINTAFKHMTAKAAEWDVPLFVGEFGVAAETRNAGDYVAALYDRLDACLASGAQWNYTPHWTDRAKDGWNGEDFSVLDPSGALRPNFRPRPYPRLTAGMPRQFEYQDAKSPTAARSLVFLWEHRPELGATKIFVPNALFPPDSTVTVSSAEVICVRDLARQVLVCRAPSVMPVAIRLTASVAR